MNGGMATVTEIEQLIKHVSKADEIEGFDEKLFEQSVEKIIVYSLIEIGFKMKCGITLKERLVR